MMDKDRALPPSEDRATHEPSQQAVSAVPVGIPSALLQAIGSLVSECADQRDIYPDADTALEAITDTVNEIYGCLEDGVFGQIAADPFPLATDAFHEALRRYPDAHGALIFLWGASGLGLRAPNAEQLEWARQRAQAIEARRAETQSGSVHESAVAEGDAPESAPHD